jgi:hypothetical protein
MHMLMSQYDEALTPRCNVMKLKLQVTPLACAWQAIDAMLHDLFLETYRMVFCFLTFTLCIYLFPISGQPAIVSGIMAQHMKNKL